MIRILFFICLFSLVGCGSQVIDSKSPTDRENGIMEITVFGIGRADAILITTENYVVMIDTGENRHGQYIVSSLLNQNITVIDYLIITHFDSDHVGGAHLIIDYLDVNKIIAPNYSRESRHVERFENAMRNANIEAFVLTETIWLTLDEAEFMINPSQLPYFSFADDDADFETSEGAFIPTGDDFSIVISITHGANNFLFTGDAVANRLQELLETDEIMNTSYDFLKVPRHGRYNRNSVPFIQAINPRYVVITGFCPSLYYYYYPERPTDERIIAALEYVGAYVFFAMSRSVHIRCTRVELTVKYCSRNHPLQNNFILDKGS